MSDNYDTHSINSDPCASFGARERWAAVWFVSVVLVGSVLTYSLAKIDRFNYDTKGVYLDNAQYRENRLATTSIGSEKLDPRARSILSSKELVNTPSQ